uniref:hypothetical protein n=1 Tax=Candidatus Electrothrix sp. TaxID=2170559 RepID=UPI0040575233
MDTNIIQNLVWSIGSGIMNARRLNFGKLYFTPRWAWMNLKAVFLAKNIRHIEKMHEARSLSEEV